MYNIGFCCSPPNPFRENIYQTEFTRTKKKEFDESSSSHLLANKRAKTRSNVGTGWTFRIYSSRSHSPIVSAMLASIPGLRPRPTKIMHIRKNQINHPPIITETRNTICMRTRRTNTRTKSKKGGEERSGRGGKKDIFLPPHPTLHTHSAE
jgi:hypothetical protein